MSTKTEKDCAAKIYLENKKLKAKNLELERKNDELKHLLEAKRYKIVDSAIDLAYRVVNKVSKKKSIMVDAVVPEENNGTDAPQKTEKIIPGKVNIVNMNFYDWDGDKIFRGGAERYVYDLACLLKKMGLKPQILQCSKEPFRKMYRGIQIVGIGIGEGNTTREISDAYDWYCSDCELIIASPLNLACEIKNKLVIGINHGINFDAPWQVYKKRLLGVDDEVMHALDNVSRCVCVDTNFINWSRTQDYNMALKNIFVPNYYDPKEFKPRKEVHKKLTFMYPRRIYDSRGYDITIEAFREIFSKYGNSIALKFVGQVDNEDAGKALKKFISEFPNNVSHDEYEMNDMAEVYGGADVVLIPTKYSEGTSLSCIEAMASEVPVLVTCVGGLPNLVIDGYNGLVVEPTVEALVSGVEKMIQNPELRHRLAINGRKVAEASFSKNVWEERWKRVIVEVMTTSKK